MAEGRTEGRVDGRGSLVDYESTKIKRTTMSTTVAGLYAFMKCFGTCQFLRGLWMDLSGTKVDLHMRTDANNLVTTATTTHLPEQKETIHMINQLRTESCSGSINDLAHVVSADCLADCLTKTSAPTGALIKAVNSGILPNLDKHPPFRQLMQHRHKAYGTSGDEQDMWRIRENIFITWVATYISGNKDNPFTQREIVSFWGVPVQQSIGCYLATGYAC
jgi:hypothetical protein